MCHIDLLLTAVEYTKPLWEWMPPMQINPFCEIKCHFSLLSLHSDRPHSAMSHLPPLFGENVHLFDWIYMEDFSKTGMKVWKTWRGLLTALFFVPGFSWMVRCGEFAAFTFPGLDVSGLTVCPYKHGLTVRLQGSLICLCFEPFVDIQPLQVHVGWGPERGKGCLFINPDIQTLHDPKTTHLNWAFCPDVKTPLPLI